MTTSPASASVSWPARGFATWPGSTMFQSWEELFGIWSQKICLIGAAAFERGVPGILCIGPLQVYQVPDSAAWGWGWGVLARQNLNYVSFGKFMYFPGGHCEKIRQSG